MKQNFDHLMRPWPDAPPRNGRRLSLPELWESAKAMFARMLEAAGGERRLKRARLFTRKERTDVLGWLGPVEKLTRVLLLAKAVTRLLMTPEGRRLMKETPKQVPWKEPAPPPKPGAALIVRIPYPGWNTIWRKPLPPPPPKPQRARACTFRVLRTSPAEPAVSAVSAINLPNRPGVIDLFAQPSRPERKTPAPSAERPSRLSRRVEALSRALDNPEPIVRRLARFIASLPPGLFRPSTDKACATGLWHHGQSEFVDAGVHLKRITIVFNRLEPG